METRYHSFMLRLWASSRTDGDVTWRASLESTETGEKHIFAQLGDLVAFLEQLTAPPSALRGDAEGDLPE